MSHAAIVVQQRDQVDGPESDRALIARVLENDGDRYAAKALYDAHAPRIFRLIHRLTGELDLARELTQDTFVRAFAQLDRFRGEAAFGTWLHRIAVTVTSNGMRKVRRIRARETPLEELLGEGDGSGGGGAVREGWLHAGGGNARSEWASDGGRAIEPDLRHRLAVAIDELPETLRVTLVMHDIEGYTHAEIAAATGVAEGTSKSRLFDARGRLRAALADFAR